MRKLIASLFVSIDGYLVAPNEDMTWVTQNFNDEMGQYAGSLQQSMGAILLGRVTYEIMTNAWPNWGDDVPGAKEMNRVPKHVVSRTLKAASWGKYENAHVIREEVEKEIDALKKQPGGDIVIYGSGKLVSSLTNQGLIDEYHLLVHPVILGGGKLLFDDVTRRVPLELVRSQSFKNGVVVSYYTPHKG
ncbi:MAG: dihydrofolate reductase family protein [Anaerolineae bacterium]